MSKQKEITEFVLNEFSELVTRWGFQPPKVTEEDWMTRIDYFKGDFGFEIELDWRDFDLFALLVRLENGGCRAAITCPLAVSPFEPDQLAMGVGAEVNLTRQP